VNGSSKNDPACVYTFSALCWRSTSVVHTDMIRSAMSTSAHLRHFPPGEGKSAFTYDPKPWARTLEQSSCYFAYGFELKRPLSHGPLESSSEAAKLVKVWVH